eukprot:GHVO01058624.1.p1 GENE.GHVO01058624.1~~GHVO01058624.1.p1  ORF type:complete len:135 (-),score=6.41 GHVO01058624.1:18-422(-)
MTFVFLIEVLNGFRIIQGSVLYDTRAHLFNTVTGTCVSDSYLSSSAFSLKYSFILARLVRVLLFSERLAFLPVHQSILRIRVGAHQGTPYSAARPSSRYLATCLHTGYCADRYDGLVGEAVILNIACHDFGGFL